jgi:hypothetical protein
VPPLPSLQTTPRPPLFHLQPMHYQNGPSLSLGQQLCGDWKSQVFLIVYFLY